MLPADMGVEQPRPLRRLDGVPFSGVCAEASPIRLAAAHSSSCCCGGSPLTANTAADPPPEAQQRNLIASLSLCSVYMSHACLSTKNSMLPLALEWQPLECHSWDILHERNCLSSLIATCWQNDQVSWQDIFHVITPIRITTTNHR